MRLSITHTTEYRYSAPLPYALQRIRLFPPDGASQSVAAWNVAIEGARKELSFRDHFGNETWLLSAEGEPHTIRITASGAVDTADVSGVVGEMAGFVPLWLFLRSTALTRPDREIRRLAAMAEGDGPLPRLHAIMAAIGAHMTFDDMATETQTQAGDAWKLRRGVCQDYAHIFCAAARVAGIPARYVSGYLMMDDRIDQAASHAWAEAYIGGLGWVGFDTANGICPDARYVRLAAGFDYRDAAPVSGIRMGTSQEALAVHISVEQ